MRRYLFATCVAVLVTGAVAVGSPQQTATLTLRSGAQLEGQLVDLGGSGFTFRVNGEDRTIPKGDVREVDFGSGGDVPEEARTLAGGSHLLVLRNGDVIEGEFYDVGGTSPIRLTFRTRTGEREFPATEVRRIFMTRVTAGRGGGGQADSPAVPAAGAGRTYRVSAQTPWTPTGITVKQGQTVRFGSTGEIRFGPNQTASTAGNGQNLTDSRAPMPGVLQGALIARIGGAVVSRGGNSGGQVFALGNMGAVVMPASGQLFLGVNDGDRSDNSGEFTVVIVAPR